MELGGAVGQSEVRYSSSGDSQFNLMVTKGSEEIYNKLCEENSELKTCLKSLQRELFDIVDLKTDIYVKRYRAELGKELESEDQIKHEIERIREELFNQPFEEAGREITAKFQQNFLKLKQFMERIDAEVAKLDVFNENNVADSSSVENDKFKGVSNVGQLKHLLRNYDALVQGQNALLTKSVNKMAHIPSPEDITSAFSRFQILKDSELDEMRSFLNQHKQVLGQQYREFEQEKKNFEESAKRMEGEKLKISQERERVEGEVRRLRQMSEHLATQIKC